MIAAVRIAITGDSIAYGRNDPAGGWAARLAEHHLRAGVHGRRVWNLAIPGATLLGMKHYSPAECRVREECRRLLTRHARHQRPNVDHNGCLLDRGLSCQHLFGALHQHRCSRCLDWTDCRFKRGMCPALAPTL